MLIQDNPNLIKVLSEIPQLGFEHHRQTILTNAQRNLPFMEKSIRDISQELINDKKVALLVSSGPSLHKMGLLKLIKDYRKNLTIICADGAYISCLRNDIYPDFLVSLDPHPTRIVRWFGDPYFEEHEKKDNYFSLQDLDVSFRKTNRDNNELNIELVNTHAHKTKLILCSASSEKVVKRVREAKFDIYWWHPLCDSPKNEEGITKSLVKLKKLPCMNTGGTVGSAAWVFASTILRKEIIGIIGMDLGYHPRDTPYTHTQHYHELVKHLGNESEEIKDYFPQFTFPLTNELFYTDATYLWYRENLLRLMKLSRSRSFNCSEAGILYGPEIECLRFKTFLDQYCNEPIC